MDEQSAPAVAAPQSAPTPAPEVSAPAPEAIPAPAAPVNENQGLPQGTPQGPPEAIPYGRFQEVNEEKKALEAKLAEYEQSQSNFDPYQVPQMQPQPSQGDLSQIPVDEYGNYDANAYFNALAQRSAQAAQQAQQGAMQAVEARLAWDKAERENPELSNPEFKKAVAGIIYSESMSSGKLVTPSDAVKKLKSLTTAAQKEGAQAQVEHSKIQETAQLEPASPVVDTTGNEDVELASTALGSQDLKARENARLALLKKGVVGK